MSSPLQGYLASLHSEHYGKSYKFERAAFKADYLPAMHKGACHISKIDVTEHHAGMFNITASRGHELRPGTYTRLHVGGILMMSDTDMEWTSNSHCVHKAHGVSLVTGLGLGCLPRALAARDIAAKDNGWPRNPITKLIVIEKEQDLIDLMAPYLEGLPFELEIIHGDALTYKPAKGLKFDFVYHDIWPDISVENLTDITRLKRVYGRRCGGNQAAWFEQQLRNLNNAERKRERYW
jgi:hypothetical protein